MELINETGLDALSFETLDPYGDAFDVVVVKMGFGLGVGRQLEPSPLPPALAEEDEAFGELNKASLQWESDLAPFKPFCDVLVNATGYPPGGRARHFEVGMKFTCPERLGPKPELPPPPQGLNPWMAPSEKDMAQWRQACEQLKARSIPAPNLIHKRLVLTGPRWMKRKRLPVRAFWGLVRVVSLGMIRRNPWKLTRPAAVAQVSLRYEVAWGGTRQVLPMDKAAQRVKRKHWLPGVDPGHREADQPIAMASDPGNTIGLGFVPEWHLKASRTKVLPAPQVERVGAPFTASAFLRWARGKQVEGLESIGLGALFRTWAPRAERAGTPNHPSAFGADEFPGLPEDFDFRFWNGAPDDQQIPFPEGGEVLELVNLCASDHPAARMEGGHTVLRFELPKDRPFLVVKDAQGRFGARALNLDTVIIEPEEGSLLLTYRVAITRDAGLQWAVLKIQKPDEPDQLGAMKAWMEQGAAHA